ncbi:MULTISPECIES: hypothetical protein [Rhizobium]|uniref:Uncharacterized protein n=1 Tax=Rhizobium esperanzae TaxID=1967781 RepID=A0A7W6UH97_9HYPH|nr:MULTISPECIES: hypothetical protein [Rhizobium]MBB4438194.1 hypothetical protein [Rhizobium esperanzae]MDH6201014.1 hypothetical protein [Rhizobium leguminosarum]OAV52111.1 hypothetical protein A6U98_00400 [Rhizobium sp. WYCCWR10014]
MATTDWPKEPLTTEAIEILDRLLKNWCAEYGCDTGSLRAQMTARILIDWFEFGVRDEGELAVLVRDQLVFDTSLSEHPVGR